MKRLLFIFLGGFAALLIVLVTRTLMLGASPSVEIEQAAYKPYDGAAIAERLRGAIQFKTISWNLERPHDEEAFTAFAAYLSEHYPAAHEAMTRDVVSGKSLIFIWPGSDRSQKPIGLLAHIDVVPVEAGTESEWTRPPFSGAVFDNAVWGRGALDNKGPLIAIMEAAERLASEGFTPARDIYFLFGHDEEIGGSDGAGEIAALLKSRGVHFTWTLDEGSGLVQGIIPGVERPVALISTGEKGSTTLKLTARGQGGHSSTPAPDTAVSILARAVLAVNDHPYPLELDRNLVSFLHAIAGELPFAQRLALANLWLTGPLIKAQLARDPVTTASMRTTTAPTMIEGGTKVNILPHQASAMVNYRIHPRDSVDAVRERAERLINDDRVSVEALGGREPSPASSTTSEGYETISSATAEIFGAVPTAPFLTLQGTDTRHYTDLADDNYRFTPFIYRSDDLQRIHGADERVSIDDLTRGAAWYEKLIRKAAG